MGRRLALLRNSLDAIQALGIVAGDRLPAFRNTASFVSPAAPPPPPPAPTTRLASLAAALPLGGWSQDIASASLTSGAVPPAYVVRGGAPYPYLTWTGKGAWDRQRQEMILPGAAAGTGTDSNGSAILRYSAQSDVWDRVSNPFGIAIGHLYDNFDIDASTRRLFKQSFQQNQGAVYVRDLDTDEVTNLGLAGTRVAVCALVFVPAASGFGSIIVAGYQAVRRFTFASRLAGAWSAVAGSFVLPGDGCVGHYNPVARCALIGGGDSATARLYRVDGDTVTDFGVPPVRMHINGYNAGHGVFVPHPSRPVSILFSGDGTIREIECASGQWRVIGSLPAHVRCPDYPADAMGSTVATTVPEWGAILLVQNRAGSGRDVAFLWRPV